MNYNENDRGHLLRMDDGSLVERDVFNIVQKIHDYDPNIHVQYLEYAANAGDAPYRLVEDCPDGCRRVMFTCWKLDETVLQRILAADSRKTDVLAVMTANNDAVRSEQKRRYKDRMGEANDIMVSYLKSRKHRWTVQDGDKTVTVDDDPKPSSKVRIKGS